MNLLDLHLAYVAPLFGSSLWHRWALITAVGAALERRVWLERGLSGIMFPNLYTFLVGKASAGKSMHGDFAVDILKALHKKGHKIRFGPDKITQAAIYKELEECVRMYDFPGGHSYKQAPLMLYASELGRNMEDFGGGLFTNELIDFYDSKGLDYTTQKRTISGGKITFFNPSISFLACTTPEFLKSASHSRIIETGLSSRILFVVERDFIKKNHNYVPLDKESALARISEMERIYRMKGPMTFNNEADALYVQYANASDLESNRTHGTFLQTYFGRKSTCHLKKVSMILAAINGRYLIRAEDVQTAHEYITELETNMHYAFGLRSIELEASMIEAIISVLPEVGHSITIGEMHESLMKEGKFIPSNGKLKAAMDTLESSKTVSRSHDGK